MAGGILVVDMEEAITRRESQKLLEVIRINAEQSGIVQVVNHGISGELIADFEGCVDRFLSQPSDEKSKLVSPTGHPFRGWSPHLDDAGRLGMEQIHIGQFNSPEEAISAGVPEKYAHHLYTDRNIWPPDDPGMADTARRYRDACIDVAKRMLSLYARSLGVPASTFPLTKKPYDIGVSINSYPACTRGDALPQRTAGEHEVLLAEHLDTTILTVLHQSGQHAGLQGKTADGFWIPVPVIPGALQIITGQVLHRWTNGRLRVWPHRVVASRTATRRSIGVFWRPSLTTVVQPLASFVGPEGTKFEPLLSWNTRVKAAEDYLKNHG